MARFVLVILLAFTVSTAALADKITIDPNTPGAQKSIDSSEKPDPRLSQKVTYKVRLKPMTVILDDWCKATGVKFICGKSVNDWIVREDVATIHAVDVPLANLMDSLARVMKFAWIKSGTDPEWTYRLVEDSKAIRRAKDREAALLKEYAAKRKKALDEFMGLSSPTEAQLAYLRENQPSLYLLTKSDAIEPVIDLLRMMPEVTQAWLDNRKLNLKASDMLPAVFQSYRTAALKLMRFYLSSVSQYSTAKVEERLTQFDQSIGDTGVRVVQGSPYNPYGYIEIGSYSIPLWQRKGMGLLLEKAVLKAVEEKRQWRDVRREMESGAGNLLELESEKQHDMLRSDTSEELLTTDDEPYLHEKLKKKIETDAVSKMVFQLAEASGFSFVTDDFRGKNRFRADEKREFGDAIKEIAKSWYMNWQRMGGAIEMWNRDWYEQRKSRVCQAWLEALRKRFKENGTLDIDDLVDIANLTTEQYYRNIACDKVLRLAGDTAYSRQDYFKFYGSLTGGQRAVLFSEAGLGLENLNDSQLETALKLVGRAKIPELEGVDIRQSGIRMAVTRAKSGKAYAYTLRAFTSVGPIPGEATFRTPVYKQPENSKANTAEGN